MAREAGVTLRCAIMALDGMILDLDGTLVDTNRLHIEAWRRAFEKLGYKFGEDRIAEEVGKGGDMLVPALIGKEADRRDGQTLRDLHPKEFEALAETRGIRAFPAAADLLDQLRRRNIRTALATSSGNAHLDIIEKHSNFPIRKLVDELVTTDDADKSKPAPDLVIAAVKKLKLSPAQCAMLGDTRYDAESARHGGVACAGLLCGGNEPAALREAGARAVYRDAADLLAHLDDALEILSPGRCHLTPDLLERFMREALAVAEQGMRAGEAPIGCVLARPDGTILARASNEMNATRNKTAHAEIVAFARAAGKVPLETRDLVLASTLEPCVMCTGAAMEAAVDTIIYALDAPADSGSDRVRCPLSPESQMPRLIGGILATESRALFETFLESNPRPEQAQFVKQLLDQTNHR